jgi:alkylhydroperoxidase family enzyme
MEATVARIDMPAGTEEERERIWQLRPEFGKAVAAFSRADSDGSILSVREREAARARIAHLNGCEPCSQARLANMAEWGVEESFYDDVDDYVRRGRYSPRETLAIEFAERFVAGRDAFDDAFWVRMRQTYDDAEILDLSFLCSKYMALVVCLSFDLLFGGRRVLV